MKHGVWTPVRAACALTCLLAGSSAWAQTAGTLPEVEVKANAWTLEPSAGAQTVPPSDLARRAAATSDTAQLLSGVPGVSLYGAGGVSSLPVINGLADDRLRIKVDGTDPIASCPNHMNPALSYTDPSQVDGIQVYNGVVPVSVGGDSIGGSVVVQSRAPEFAPAGSSQVSGEVGAFYRSNNNASGINLSAAYRTDSLSLSYSAASSKADNYTAGGDFKNYSFTGRLGHTLGLDEVGSTAYETLNHSLALAYKSGRHTLQAKIGVQDMPFQLYPNQRMDMLYNKQDSVNLSYLGNLDWGTLEVRAYRENVDHFMDFGPDKRYWYGGSTVNGVVTGSGGSTALNGIPCSPISAVCAAGMPMYTEGKTTGLSVKSDLALGGRDLLRLGAELQNYRINDWWPPSGAGMSPGTFWNIQDGQRDRSGVFAEWEANPNAQWKTLIGARLEQVRMDAANARGYSTAATAGGNQVRDANAFNAASHASTDHNLDWTAMAKYTASAQHDIEFGLSRKVRSPNVYERFPWSTWQMAALMNNFVGDGNGYIGNLALKPEKAHTLSATFDWHAADGAWGFKAMPFYTRVDDYIDAVQWDGTANKPAAVPVVNKFSVLKYVNQSARLYGLNLAGHMPLANTDWGNFGLKGLLNYTNGRNQDTGDGLYNVMPLNAQITLTHKAGGWDSALEWIVVKAKTQVSSVRNEVVTPGYALLNLRTSTHFKKARLDLGVENLFNKFYYLPTGGAYTGQGTTMSNPALPNYPQWGTAVPGMGRSIYVGMNLPF